MYEKSCVSNENTYSTILKSVHKITCTKASIATKTMNTVAVERTICVRTRGIGVTVMGSNETFVYI